MRKHGSVWLALALLAVLAVPLNVLAQDETEEAPRVLRVSFFMCDLSGDTGDRINEEMETRDMPVWNALVDEGMAMEHGYFFHSWADEWNVGVYTVGESIEGIIAAVDEAGDRLEEQYGDAPTALGEACPHHRDGFYTFGPTTEDDEAAGGP